MGHTEIEAMSLKAWNPSPTNLQTLVLNPAVSERSNPRVWSGPTHLIIPPLDRNPNPRFAFSAADGNDLVTMPADDENVRELYFHPGDQYLFHPASNIVSCIGTFSWAIFGALKLADAAWFSLTLTTIVSAVCSIGYALERAHYRQSFALGILEVLSPESTDIESIEPCICRLHMSNHGPRIHAGRMHQNPARPKPRTPRP